MTLYFLTGNQNKIDEARMIIPGIEQLKIDLPEIQSANAEDIIRAKLLEARKHHGGEFIVDDTSLHFECLNGLPGPLIKWFIKGLKEQGVYDLTRRYGNHRAYVRCLVGYSNQDTIKFFEGIVQGQIVPPRGVTKFDWDSIFQPDGYEKTYAEMSKEEKNKISHRKLALQQLKDYLN